MKFIDDGMIQPAPPRDALPPEVSAAALLAACAAEAQRQAEGLRKLDSALGEALAYARSRTRGEAGEATLLTALAAELQQADSLRQLAEGLARVLALLAETGIGEGQVTAQDVLACTPVRALQDRLLLPAGHGPARG